MLNEIQNPALEAAIGYGLGTALKITSLNGALFLVIKAVVVEIASKIFSENTNSHQALKAFSILVGVGVAAYALPLSSEQAYTLLMASFLASEALKVMERTYRHLSS